MCTSFQLNIPTSDISDTDLWDAVKIISVISLSTKSFGSRSDPSGQPISVTPIMWATWEEMDTREENLSPNPMTLDFRPVKPFLYPEPRCLISLQWSTCGNYLFLRKSLASACKNIRPQSWLSSVQESRDVLRLLSTGLTHNAGLPSWTLSRFMPFNLLLSLKIFLQCSGMSEIFPSNAHTPVSRLKSTK